MSNKWLSLKGFRGPWRYSVLVAYVLYFTGGIFGLHLLYLRRYRHAFVSLSTLGGGLFCGLLYDLFHIPTYVKLANKLRFQRKKSKSTILASEDFHAKAHPRPELDMVTLICQIAFGVYVGTVSLVMVPTQLIQQHAFVAVVVQTLFVAVGSHTAANAGCYRCPVRSCLVGSLLPLLLFLPLDATNWIETWGDTKIGGDGRSGKFARGGVDFGGMLVYSAIVSAVLSYIKGWRRVDAEKDWSEKLTGVKVICCVLSCVMFLTLVIQAILWNVQYMDADRRKVTLGNYLESQDAWETMKREIKKLLITLREKGPIEFLLQLVESVAPDVFSVNAYKALNLPTNATLEEITSQFRKLAKKWHPDKFVTEGVYEKRWAEKQFIVVRQAYEELTKHANKEL